ncbi:hypothetical protein MRX96_018398 [Rhipicephalus microplus]
MSSPGRGVIARIWRNFLASITTKQLPQREVGRDHFGNKYFEIAADPSRGKRKPRRWFEPRTKDNFAADMPPRVGSLVAWSPFLPSKSRGNCPQ